MEARSSGERIRLRDGRMLGYREYGDRDGTPVFYFHGHPGSRLEWPAFDAHDSAAELKARIIAVDRPGHGASDFKPRRRILDWPDDVEQLAHALQLEQFSVLGISGGGPYAAACAFKIPHSLAATGIVCGMGPANAPGMKNGLAWRFAAGRNPLMRRLMLGLMSFGLRKKPEAFTTKMAEGMKGPDAALLRAEPSLAKQIAELSFAEALRNGIAGVNHDATLYARPWGFRLEDISVPVSLWHGEADDNVPVLVGRYVADAIPGCSAHFLPNEGHLSLPYNHLPDIVRALVA